MPVNKILLSKEQVEELLWENKYKIDGKEKLTNLDELSVIILAGENFGFDVDKEKTAKITKEVVGKTNVSKHEAFSGAILQIRGNYSVSSAFSVSSNRGEIQGKLFIFHETITNRNHRVISKKLIGEKAVKLYPGTDEEYLYEVLSETTENYVIETVKRLASGLPLYLVKFADSGSFTIEEMGTV